MSSAYDEQVFVNCPFDEEYRPLFEATVFAIYDCGFRPRCALEAEDSSQVRVDKIASMIRQCRLAVHDISRTELDAANQLPRFNMPFEFGLDVGAKRFGGREHRRKACIVFDIDRYRYQKFLSDIAGQDIRAHARDPVLLIRHLRDFLSTYRPSDVFLPDGDVIAHRYHSFRRILPSMCRESRLNPKRLTFTDLTVLIVSWLEVHPLPHHRFASAA